MVISKMPILQVMPGGRDAIDFANIMRSAPECYRACNSTFIYDVGDDDCLMPKTFARRVTSSALRFGR